MDSDCDKCGGVKGDNQRCKAGHQQSKPELKQLVHYSGKIVTCWKRLALQLSLSPEAIDIIDVNHVDVNDKCYDMFNTWLRQTCDPCWCQVANAFKMVELNEVAREIETKLVVTVLDHAIEPTKRRERPRLSSIDDIEAEFGIMVASVQEALENSKINVNKLLIKLKSSSAVRDRNIPLFDPGVFERVTSIDKLFETLSGYWHLFDYDVLMYLVKTAGCKEAKAIYDDFLASFDSSAMTNHKLILQYDEYIHKEGLLPGTCKLRIKVARDECTVEVEQEVKKVISEYFNLEKYALIFKGIKEGCIELIFQISHSVKSYMLQHKLNGYNILQLKAHKIIALKFDIMQLNIPEDFSDERYILSWSTSDTSIPYLSQQLNMLHENLKKWYRKLKSTRSIVEETIWSVFPTYHCIGYLSVFHDLSQHGNHTSTLKLLSNVQELFEENGSLRIQHVLLEGHTGIGKTTLCKEICYQWAENNLFMPEELVLLLLLQDPCARKITSEYELAEYFTTSFDFIESFSEYLTSSCGAGVTIIIDSYDQLDEELLEEGFIKDLVGGKRLPKARVVITSTPFVSYHLHDCVDRRVEIFELVKSVRNKFIAAALKNVPAKFNVLQKHFLEYPEIDMLSCVPINMAIIVSLCHKDILTHDELSSDKLPLSAAGMYEAFCEYVMEINFSAIFHIEKEIHEDMWFEFNYEDMWFEFNYEDMWFEFNYEDMWFEFNYEDMWFEFNYKAEGSKKLHYFAFVALIKNKLVFPETDLFDLCRDYPTCYGFMQSTEYYSSAYHNKRISYNFLCQGIHQYLAASYETDLSKNKNNIIDILKNCLAMERLSLFHFMPIDWSMQVLNVCIFAIRYTNETVEDAINGIINNLDKDIKSYSIHVHNLKRFEFSKQQKSDIAFDTGSSAVKFPSVENFNVNAELDQLIPQWHHDSDFDSLYPDSGYISKKTSHEDDLKVTVISMMLEYPPFLSLCLYQIFSANYISKNIVRDSKIVFTHYYLLPYHITSLGLYLLLCNNEVVNEIHLGDCSIGDYGLYLLLRYLQFIENTDALHEDSKLNVLNLQVTNLQLDKNNLTSASSVFISNIIDLLKLHSLGLGCNKLTDAGVTKICSAVIRNKIQVLNLMENRLTSQGARSISLMMNVLKELDISNNSIGDQGIKMLSQGLARTQTLKHLDINHCSIGAIGNGELAHALTINSSLEILRMNGNAIGHSGAAGIAAALSVNKTLKELSLIGDPTIDYTTASEILESYMNKNTTLIKLYLPKSLSNKFLITVKYNTIHEHKKRYDKPRSLFFQ